MWKGGNQMTRDSFGSEPRPDGDASIVGRLADDFVARRTRGEDPDLEEYVARAPGHAAELRQAIDMALLLVDLGGPSHHTIDAASQGGAVAPAPVMLLELGDYRIVRERGRGGMGVVYEAWQRSMERRVALKVLPPGIAANEKAFQRFLREARAAGMIDHPNVVPVHALGVEKDVPYYVMEYVEGETLAQLLGKLRAGGESAAPEAPVEALATFVTQHCSTPGGPRGAAPKAALPALGSRAQEASPQALEINLKYCLWVAGVMAGVADGLQQAHAKGIVHRDIKPSNLILDQGGCLRILDFGLAHQEGQESLTQSGDLLGTVLYMSPEQAMARRVPIDHRTDIFSLGATMYEMLTWHPPHEGSSSHDTLHQIICCDPRPLRKRNSCVPRDLETIVLKCLQKDPSERYRTADGLAQDLRRFVKGELIEARPHSTWERWYRRGSRNKGKVIASACIALLLLVSGFLSYSAVVESRDRATRWYERSVEAAAMNLLRGQTTLQAETGRSAVLDPKDLLIPGDYGLLGCDRGQSPLEGAIADLTLAVEALPQRFEAHYYRGRALLLVGRSEEALEELRLALRCRPDFLPAGSLCREIEKGPVERSAAVEAGGWEVWWVRAHEAARDSRWEEAAEGYGRLLQLEETGSRLYLGSSMEILMGRGVARLKAKDLAGAIEDFAAARRLWPQHIEPALLLGKTYSLRQTDEDRRRAEETFQQLYDRTDARDEAAAWISAVYKSLADHDRGLEWADRVTRESVRERLRADHLFRLHRMKEAQRASRRTIELNPQDHVALTVLGWALVFDLTGRFGASVRDEMQELARAADRALQLDPQSSQAHAVHAMRLALEGRLDEAADAGQKAIDLNQENACAHATLGGVRRYQGKLEEAEWLCRKSIEVSPLERYGILCLGEVLLDLGKPAEAMQAYRDAIRVDPKFAWPHARLGFVLIHLGQPEAALEPIDRAAALFPENNPAHEYRALALLRLGRLQEALEAGQRAVARAPDRPDAHFHLGLVLERAGDIDAAVKAFGSALALNPRHGAAQEKLSQLKRTATDLETSQRE
jgi:serine/threonine protein kinase/Tfp pilus assembly protein PilF